MSKALKAKLAHLGESYRDKTGQDFAHFFCPILFKDEETELCRAHVVNEALPGLPRPWTVQRKDVDGFYGSAFEPGLVDVEKLSQPRSAFDILNDRALSKRMSRRILLNEQSVEFLHDRRGIPNGFTRVSVDGKELDTPFGLRMHPIDVIASSSESWQLEYSVDLRIEMVVSVIKAAHLSLFHLLGYRYALMPSGRYVGGDILGKFFQQNRGKRKRDVLKNAHPFFREFRNMVRPLIACPFPCEGTISDSNFLVCVGSSGCRWGLIVLVRTGAITHAAMMPLFETPDEISTYLDFMRNDNCSIQASHCRFVNDRWEISKNTFPLTWPKTGVLYPDEPD